MEIVSFVSHLEIDKKMYDISTQNAKNVRYIYTMYDQLTKPLRSKEYLLENCTYKILNSEDQILMYMYVCEAQLFLCNYTIAYIVNITGI